MSAILRFRSLALALIVTASGSAASLAQKPVLQKHVPELVTQGAAPRLGLLASTEQMHLALNLPLRNQEALDALLFDLYNPQSPNFHHWLQPEEFDARFGPLRADTQTVVDWARSKGFTVTFLATNGRIVEVDGSVDAVNAAFHVTETMFHDSARNRDFHAPDREPLTDLPFALLSVDGLDDATPKFNNLRKDPNAGVPALVAAPVRIATAEGGFLTGINDLTPNARRTLAPHVSGSGPSGSYLPADMRAAYYGNGNLTGAGQNVAVFSFDGYLTSDLNVYYNNTGMTTTVPVSNVLVAGYSGGCFSSGNGTSGTCDDGEQILDIVQVQGMAPGLANIYFYEGTTANTILNQMVTDNKVKVITSSWGGGGFGTASDTYFQQMATAGITFLNATGDSGAFNKTTYYAPSLSPYITQVGGTDLVTTGAGGAWSGEVAWAYSSGGYWFTGMSSSGKYTIPTWQAQTGVINGTNKGSTLYRNVPDLAAEGNYDNPTVSNGAFLVGYGGTSYATPRVAGYIAMANEQAAKNGLPSVGFINPALYTAGLSASAATVYHDVASGSNPATGGTATSYNSVAGYDLVTGWGSPNGAGLINALAGAPAADYALSAAPVSVTRGGDTVSDFITVTSFNNFTGTVAFTATGLPTGVTATYSPGNATAPGAITFQTADNTAVMGTYNVTVTGTSGSLVHTVVIPLTVKKRAGSDFTLTATAVTVNQGGSGSSTIQVTPANGLSGGIALGVSNLPPGITASLSSSLTTDPGTGAVPATITLSLSALGAATPASYTVIVTGTSLAGIVHTVAVPLTVSAAPSLLVNGGFETGTAAPWTFTSVGLYGVTSGFPPHGGNYFALLGNAQGTNSVAQQVSIPAGGTKATLGAWVWVLTNQTGNTAIDTMSFQITSTGGTLLSTLGSLSNLSGTGYWSYVSYDVSAYIGQTVVVKISGTQAGTTVTDFLLDDVSLATY